MIGRFGLETGKVLFQACFVLLVMSVSLKWSLKDTNFPPHLLPLTTTTSLLSLKMVWLLTMLTMATPKLHRIPKEMQKPMPERMAMM